MPKLFVLSYAFLDKAASVLVQKKKSSGGLEYHVLLLDEPMDAFFIPRLIFDAHSPLQHNKGNV